MGKITIGVVRQGRHGLVLQPRDLFENLVVSKNSDVRPDDIVHVTAMRPATWRNCTECDCQPFMQGRMFVTTHCMDKDGEHIEARCRWQGNRYAIQNFHAYANMLPHVQSGGIFPQRKNQRGGT